MKPFKALRVSKSDGGQSVNWEDIGLDDLSEGDVVVRVSHSTINYKDALAATGAGKILRSYPLVGGIDLAGTVVSSTDTDYAPGTAVLVNGCGLSETRDGGYAEYARVDSASVVPIPAGMTPEESMQIGTANAYSLYFDDGHTLSRRRNDTFSIFKHPGRCTCQYFHFHFFLRRVITLEGNMHLFNCIKLC